jgi:hypothetical protein
VEVPAASVFGQPAINCSPEINLPLRLWRLTDFGTIDFGLIADRELTS